MLLSQKDLLQFSWDNEQLLIQEMNDFSELLIEKLENIQAIEKQRLIALEK